jgi:uncharacterized alpha-E superfamily protein
MHILNPQYDLVMPIETMLPHSKAWLKFKEICPSDSWASLETRADEMLVSTNASRPFVSQQEHRKHRFDPIPYCIDQQEWQVLCEGLVQRTRCLNAVLADLYGEQRACYEGLINIRELFSLKNFVLPAHGVTGMGLPQLHLSQVQVAKTSKGFRVVKDITSTPQRLGMIIEQRMVSNRIMPLAQEALCLRRLAHWFGQFRFYIYTSSPKQSEASYGVVLSRGIDKEGYEEHAYLAHFLGIPIVEATDLTVRDGQIYLKNLGELQRVHFVLRRVPETGIDPLELGEQTDYGVGGLFDAIRRGEVFMDAVPGVGIVEKKVIFERMPALCEFFLKEKLLLPQIHPSESLREDVLPTIQHGAIKNIPYHLQLSLYAFGQDIQVMPGGLAISIAVGELKPNIKDLWVCGEGFAEPVPPLFSNQVSSNELRQGAGVSSRVADATLWFGRYLERADTLTRVLREILLEPQREAYVNREVMPSLHLSLVQKALEIGPENSPAQDWSKHWMAMVKDPTWVGNLLYNLNGVQRNAHILRDRISSDMLQIAQGIVVPYLGTFHMDNCERLLSRTLEQIAALTGLSIDSMTHSDEWNFLVIGRRLERACSTLSLLASLCEAESFDKMNSWELLLRTFDSIMTYRWRYRLQFEPLSVVEMMLKDTTNPRSVAFQTTQILETLALLETQGAAWANDLRLNLQRDLDQVNAIQLEAKTLSIQLLAAKDALMSFYDQLTKILLHL